MGHILDRFGGHLDSAQPLLYPPNVETAALHGASPWLLNALGSPRIPGCTDATQQPWAPGVAQPFPTTAVDLIKALDSPAGVLVANIVGAYLCANVGNQLDALGLGPALVQAGGALDSREAIGLGQAGSFTAKVAIELLGGAEVYADAGAAFGDANASIATALVVFRINPNANAAERWLVTKWNGAVGWTLSCSSTYLRATAAGSLTTQRASLAVDPRDGAWHYAIVSVDDTTKIITLHSDLGTVASVAYTGSVTNAGSFSLGYTANSFSGQFAVCYVLDAALLAAAGTAFWRHANAAGLGTPNTYARANPLVVPIQASRVACYSANQLAVGYDPGFLVDGNAQRTGIVCEDGATYLGLNSIKLPAYAGMNATVVAADGPSGMRDAARVTDADIINIGYASYGAATLAGATAVAFRFGMMVQAVVGGGTNALLVAYFTGDGGGPETLLVSALAGTVPASYGRFGGTVTPAGNAHTGVSVVLTPTDGVPASVGSVDFAEVWGVQNFANDVLAWRRVGWPAAAATSTPALSMTNLLNARYSPVRGRARIRISGFQGTSGAVFLDCALAGTAGSMQVNYNAGQLIMRIWDATPALVAALNCGALGAGEYILDVLWDARVPIIGNAAGGHMIVKQGATILGEGGAAWTPPTAAVTPIAVGATVGGTGAARCYISLVSLSSLPGSVYD